MKRKGKRSKTTTNITNGTNGTQNESVNGPFEESEIDNSKEGYPKEKSVKRKSGTVKSADVSKNENLPNDEPIENITQNGQSAEHASEGQPEAKKRRTGGKRKSSAKHVEERTEVAEEAAQYEVEAILDEKMIRGVRHYLIRWKGYEPESDSWEPETTLNCAELIAAFKAKQKKRGNKKAKSKTSLNKKLNSMTWNENDKFEVDRILDVYFKKNGNREFLVSWKGYPMSQSTWEPEENMDCPDLIAKFMEKVEKAKKIEKRELRVNRTHTDRFTLTMLSRQRRLSKRNEGRQRVQYHDAE